MGRTEFVSPSVRNDEHGRPDAKQMGNGGAQTRTRKAEGVVNNSFFSVALLITVITQPLFFDGGGGDRENYDLGSEIVICCRN